MREAAPLIVRRKAVGNGAPGWKLNFVLVSRLPGLLYAFLNVKIFVVFVEKMDRNRMKVIMKNEWIYLKG